MRVAWKASVEVLLELPNALGESVVSSDRFFPATILGGRLHVRGLPDRGSWNPARLEWELEEYADMLVSIRQADRKVRTLEELETVMKEPMGPSPTRYVWLHESLVNEARRLWEDMSKELS